MFFTDGVEVIQLRSIERVSIKVLLQFAVYI
jgi:hypothetical protein